MYSNKIYYQWFPKEKFNIAFPYTQIDLHTSYTILKTKFVLTLLVTVGSCLARGKRSANSVFTFSNLSLICVALVHSCDKLFTIIKIWSSTWKCPISIPFLWWNTIVLGLIHWKKPSWYNITYLKSLTVRKVCSTWSSIDQWNVNLKCHQ